MYNSCSDPVSPSSHKYWLCVLKLRGNTPENIPSGVCWQQEHVSEVSTAFTCVNSCRIIDGRRLTQVNYCCFGGSDGKFALSPTACCFGGSDGKFALSPTGQYFEKQTNMWQTSWPTDRSSSQRAGSSTKRRIRYLFFPQSFFLAHYHCNCSICMFVCLTKTFSRNFARRFVLSDLKRRSF